MMKHIMLFHFGNIKYQRDYAARCGYGCICCTLHLAQFSCRLAQTNLTGQELGMWTYTG